MHRILLIDDDAQLGPPLATYFQRFELELIHALKPSDGQREEVAEERMAATPEMLGQAP
eukprot:gene2910-3763_t